MAHRQEQEKADSNVTEVAPNVLRMQLPIRMPGLGHVNMYALLDKNGATVIDPGLPGPFTWRAIQDRLRQADLKTKDVHTVLITHSHPDHFGGARRFVKEHGAKVIAHRTFRFGLAKSIVEKQPEISLNDLEAQQSVASDIAESGDDLAAPHSHSHGAQPPSDMGWWGGPTPWGGQQPRPPLGRRLMFKVMHALNGSMAVPDVTHPVEQGDCLQLAGREMFVVHTPGHTPDHFCLHDPEAGIFFAGDHVLPTITPHISGISTAEDPLLSFFDSLDRVGEISAINRVLPAHGHPFNDLRERTDAIKRHHYERLERIREISQGYGRPASVKEFSQHLFRRRSWGSMAESETYAHLEHLRHAGQAESHRDGRDILLFQTG
jgi:glyoxylase-like metal-dependent hydrolase (beta-lactamase superfamily II)